MGMEMIDGGGKLVYEGFCVLLLIIKEVNHQLRYTRLLLCH